MPSVSDFTRQIDSIDFSSLEGTFSSTSEARALLKLAREYQRQLRQIKKSVTLEVKTIRAEYRDKVANAGSVVGGAFSLFGKRGMGGRIRADAKRGMVRERDSVIAPYEQVKLVIDDYVHEIDNIKNQIESHIIDLKEIEAEQKVISSNSTSSKSTSFCTACGAKAAKSHKFCAQCGEKI